MNPNGPQPMQRVPGQQRQVAPGFTPPGAASSTMGGWQQPQAPQSIPASTDPGVQEAVRLAQQGFGAALGPQGGQPDMTQPVGLSQARAAVGPLMAQMRTGAPGMAGGKQGMAPTGMAGMGSQK